MTLGTFTALFFGLFSVSIGCLVTLNGSAWGLLGLLFGVPLVFWSMGRD